MRQAVTVTVDPPGTCLSVDSGFNLTAGVGTFPGSICEPNVQDVRLMFTVTSAVSMADVPTSSSPTFNVTGENKMHDSLNLSTLLNVHRYVGCRQLPNWSVLLSLC